MMKTHIASMILADEWCQPDLASNAGTEAWRKLKHSRFPTQRWRQQDSSFASIAAAWLFVWRCWSLFEHMFCICGRKLYGIRLTFLSLSFLFQWASFSRSFGYPSWHVRILSNTAFLHREALLILTWHCISKLTVSYCRSPRFCKVNRIPVLFIHTRC
jgi:hypothetical protein